MRRSPILLTALFAVTGCMTTGSKIVSITSDPTDALVRVDGFGECNTPCSVEVDAPRSALVAKAGFEAQKIILSPKRARAHVVLKLAAPTEDVESTTLPDVQ